MDNSVPPSYSKHYEQSYSAKKDDNAPHHFPDANYDGNPLPPPQGGHGGGFVPNTQPVSAPNVPYTGYQDKVFALAYIITTLITIILSFAFFGGVSKVVDPGSTDTMDFKTGHRVALAISVVFSLVSSGLYVMFVQRQPKLLIHGSFFFSMVLAIALSAVFAISNPLFIIVGIILALMILLYWFIFSSYIDFSAALISFSSKVTLKYPAAIFSSYLGCLFSIGYVALISFGLVGCAGTLSSFNTNTGRHHVSGAFYLVLCYFVFNFFWTLVVVSNILHVTISGLFASHYFQSSSPNGVPSNPTLGAAKRAMTTSFGPICYGSLIVAIIKFLRFLVDQATDNNNSLAVFMSCIVDCFLAYLEAAVKFVNSYAFVQVAIYNKPYCVAAKDTWAMLCQRGLEAFASTHLVDRVLVLCSIIGACLSALVSALLLVISGIALSAPGSPAIMLLSALFGFTCYAIVGSVLDSGVTALFVCFAEAPEVARTSHPEFYSQVQSKFPTAVLTF